MERGNSSPIQMVRQLQMEILRKTGRRPTKLRLGREVYDEWMRNTEIQDRAKYAFGEWGWQQYWSERLAHGPPHPLDFVLFPSSKFHSTILSKIFDLHTVEVY